LSIYDHRESGGLSCLRLPVNQHRYKTASSRHTGKAKRDENVHLGVHSYRVDEGGDGNEKVRNKRGWEAEKVDLKM
jgi:hypothetical protein